MTATPYLQPLTLSIQFAVGSVLLVAGLSKLRHPVAFATSLNDFNVLPPRISVVFGLLTIAAEIVVGLSHLSGIGLAISVWIGLILLGLFSIAVCLTLYRSVELECHCFGSQSGEVITGRSLGRLILMIAGELYLLPVAGTQAALVYARSSFEIATAVCLSIAGLVISMWILVIPEVAFLLIRLIRAR